MLVPDLPQPAPPPDEPPAPAEIGLRLHKARHEFQKGLLKWLRGDPAGIAEMKSAVAAIAATQTSPGSGSARSLWRSALALLDALAAGSIAADHETQRLCARIEAQIRRLAQGIPDATPVDDQLDRELLSRIDPAHPVRAGGTILSKTLYELYLAEARGHLDVLERELQLHAALPPSTAMIGAAGTLAAISDTIGRAPIKALALALERALARMSRLAAAPGDGGYEVLQEAISALREMAEAAARRQPIEARVPLVAVLDGLAGNQVTSRLP